jgi:hypothetical protein
MSSKVASLAELERVLPKARAERRTSLIGPHSGVICWCANAQCGFAPSRSRSASHWSAVIGGSGAQALSGQHRPPREETAGEFARKVISCSPEPKFTLRHTIARPLQKSTTLLVHAESSRRVRFCRDRENFSGAPYFLFESSAVAAGVRAALRRRVMVILGAGRP